jgi:ABC-type multidrug transport system permease subunit
MYYDEKWRNWGLGFIYIAFNITAIFAFYYLFILIVWGLWIKRSSKQGNKGFYEMQALG